MTIGSSIRLDWPNKNRLATPTTAHRLELSRPGHPACMLIKGDNLPAMRALATRTGPVFALAYLDPPFFSGKQYRRVSRRRDNDGSLVRSYSEGFDDRWPSLQRYLEELYARVSAARDLLLPDGCLVLHVDPKTSHYAKVLCDEIFGSRAFASEIVWRYRRWPSKTPNFQRVHDVLLRYVRNPDVPPRFRQLYEPLAPSTLATWGEHKQRAVVDIDGRRQRSSTTAERTPGTPLGDVWEIGIVAPVARERTGYPTQKPELLIERLIEACTEKGDLVLDPYAGSGTTLAVCARIDRRAVGIDSNSAALAITRQRLKAQKVSPLEERLVAVRKSTGPRPRARAKSTSGRSNAA